MGRNRPQWAGITPNRAESREPGPPFRPPWGCFSRHTRHIFRAVTFHNFSDKRKYAEISGNSLKYGEVGVEQASGLPQRASRPMLPEPADERRNRVIRPGAVRPEADRDRRDAGSSSGTLAPKCPDAATSQSDQ